MHDLTHLAFDVLEKLPVLTKGFPGQETPNQGENPTMVHAMYRDHLSVWLWATFESPIQVQSTTSSKFSIVAIRGVDENAPVIINMTQEFVSLPRPSPFSLDKNFVYVVRHWRHHFRTNAVECRLDFIKQWKWSSVSHSHCYEPIVVNTLHWLGRVVPDLLLHGLNYLCHSDKVFLAFVVVF